MNREIFREKAHEVVDWMVDYLENVESRSVLPNVKPGDIKKQLPDAAPDGPENFDEIFNDFKEIIVPGMTHWQHPSFFGYFPANSSEPSILAEMLTSTMGAQCMIWLTSPAAEELEECVMNWTRQLLGLPDTFTGVIQDTASTATLVAILNAREVRSDYQINQKGFTGREKYTVYSSAHVHSSIDKAVRISGIGIDSLRRIPVDENFGMIPSELEKQVIEDISKGFQPLIVISAFGTTSSTAMDPVDEISSICQKYQVWHHVDAAYAGSALILPEKRALAKGVERADSFVFNPHKWLFTNFDCCAYFVKDTDSLVKTFSVNPEYLKTQADEKVKNYRDWGIQLGRRFRALKLWFVIRHFGADGLREKLRSHIEMSQNLAKEIETHANFELLAPVPFNTICFRYVPSEDINIEQVNLLNEELLRELNASGKMFVTHTVLDGRYTIRIVIGQTNVTQKHVDNAWNLIRELSTELG